MAHLDNFSVKRYIIFCLLVLFVATSEIAVASEDNISKLDNPINISYLEKNLRKSSPRLVYTSKNINLIKKKLKSDPVVQNMYSAINATADKVHELPLLERKVEGRRLLGVSREMLRRINMLGVVYMIEKDPKTLNRINDELVAVCNFSDWNPSHFLDVAEMSLAVAFAIDWTADALPKTTQELALKALVEKGIQPSWPANGKNPGWAYGTNNWNQVCNGGMIAASIMVADREPELAAKTIYRALDGLPHSLVEYGPDGVYPEGSTYWGYGTSYSVVTIALLESAFKTDFGMGEYPAFQESATFRVLANAPSGWYYNFADCGDKRNEEGDIILAWFAKKTGNSAFFEGDRFLTAPEQMGKLSRLTGAALVWIAQYEFQSSKEVATAWKGEGSNPIVIFTGGANDPHQFYFGGKGGRGMVNHGNMDGGSFIFELNGVRWVVDPGNQSYHALEKTGFDLWDRSQDSDRWTLLTKNNFGHSTISINSQLHKTEGLVKLINFKKGNEPEATFDLTATLGKSINQALRTFRKDSDSSILIEDLIEINDKTESITWQLLTQAHVEIVEGGAILKHEGKELKLENISHPDLMVSVISLDPPPLKLDRRIENLKRIEIQIPAWVVKDQNCQIKVRLSEN